MCEGYFAIVPYVAPGKYVAYAFSYTGGALLQWCVDTIAKEEKRLAKERGISVNEYLEQNYKEQRGKDAPSNLLVLPHFAGAATPYMDNGSKGAVIGLTMDSTAADIYRGCIKEVRCEELAEKKGCSVLQLAVGWMFTQRMNVYALASTTRVARLKENLKALYVEVSEEEGKYLNLEK